MKIILVGQGGSGKDYLKDKLIKKGFKPSVSYTTRPARDSEKEGKDYFFVSEPEFKRMIDAGEFREWNIFGDKGWYYGTSKSQFDEANLFIMTPSGIEKLTPEERRKFVVVYLDIPRDIRRKRLYKRNDVDDPERRLISDDETFAGFDDYDVRVTNPDFTVEQILDSAKDALAQKNIQEK